MDPRPINFEYRRRRPENRTFLSYGTGNSLYYLGLVNRQPPSDHYMRMQYNLPLKSVRAYNNSFENESRNLYNQFAKQNDQPRENINSRSSQNQNINANYRYQNNNYQNQLQRQLVNKDRMFSSPHMKSSSIQRNQSKDMSFTQNHNQYKDRYSYNPSANQNNNYIQKPKNQQPPSRDAIKYYQRDRVNSSHLSNYGTNIMKAPAIDQNKIYQRQQKQYNIITCFPRQFEPKLKQFPKFTLQHTQYKKIPYQLNSNKD